ncbi:anti-sigma-F factor Fin family protein [Alkalihalobacillus sp. AL-G]|uniref:anti-sigma-F factor Fin family protein n=1 Tax=Alkalihalobacillus sp. AL-G TaxID=2926399 RepID=UPI0027296C28|nr:anti-sigma-F factor Fin family protein [Alkalihalobacillus sp. AL-G]WLD93463.1 anti-sigma-F factor Fin family protein [Alkalihalobacillus sp. AL-G]
MNIYYSCKHCRTPIGKIDVDSVNTVNLGFDHLSENERQEYLSYDEDGQLHVKSICEDCYEMLIKNPDYHALDSFIQ